MRPPAEHAGADSGTTYVCPMHPQIRRPAPGNCPICGMALEPEMPSLDEQDNPELFYFRRRFWWTLPLTLAGVALAMASHRFTPLSPQAMSWTELVLATPVVLWAAFPFVGAYLARIRPLVTYRRKAAIVERSAPGGQQMNWM